jgi:hypothetical protein
MFLKMTSPKTLIFTALFSVLLLVLSTDAQAPAANAGSFVRQGRVGLCAAVGSKGGHAWEGRTVFRGSEAGRIQRRDTWGVPGGIGPKQDLIVGRLSGGGADRTSVFAGMSGSPVYIDGKLLGAISYSFPFSKEPICGITPIEQMIAIFEQKQPAKTAAAERGRCHLPNSRRQTGLRAFRKAPHPGCFPECRPTHF